MKQTVQAQIGGLTFFVDDDAYARLQAYLRNLRNHYGNTAEASEIVADVEARIAEILQGKTVQSRRAVQMDDVLLVISILGEVEQFDDTPTESAKNNQGTYSKEDSFSNTYTPKFKKMERRRIFRDPDNRKLGGVCAGLAAYLGLNSNVVRALFAIAAFFYGTSVLVYILLWFMVPEARTTGEKLEMRGDKINVENIERTIRDEFQNFRRNAGF